MVEKILLETSQVRKGSVAKKKKKIRCSFTLSCGILTPFSQE